MRRVMKMKLKPNFERKRADRPTKRLLRDRRFCIQIKHVTFTEGDVTARRFHLFGTQYVASETRVRLYWQHRSSSHICPVLPYRRFTVVGGGLTDNYKADSEQVSVRGKEEAALPVFSKQMSKRSCKQEALRNEIAGK